MDYSTRLLWKNKMHPEIYNANCDFNETELVLSIFDMSEENIHKYLN